jgi:hypothetical protein
VTTDPEKSEMSAPEESYGLELGKRAWDRVLLLVTALWVVRVPIVTTALGLVILDKLPQAQDMFIDSSASKRQLLFLAPMLLIWALPTYYASQELLETDARFQRQAAGRGTFARVMQVAVALVLGLLTFTAVFVGMRQAHAILEAFRPNVQDTTAIDNAETALFHHEVLLFACVAAFIALIYWFPRLSAIFRRPAIRRAADLLPGWGWLSALLILFIAILTSLILFPVQAAAWFPRGFSIPFILGGWLPFLSYLGSLGRQLRVPIITGLGLTLILLNAFLGDDHAVRLLQTAQTADTQRVPLEQAVTWWKTANSCDQKSAACPRPIVIATAGGASRAAFFTASVIGQLMTPAADDPTFDPNTVRNRLFAISSVSGGSMGAVMVTAALNATTDSRNQPCGQSAATLWWGTTIGTWRDCFEALTSGDFLTPVIFGLAYHDAFGFFPIKDRAVLLENAWSRRFSDLVTRADTPPQNPNCVGLDCQLLTLKPRTGHWIPLLILNGTSERTGGRIITTPLATEYTANGKCSELFPLARNFYDLVNPKTTCEAVKTDAQHGAGTQAAAFEDLRVSTAALNSARFPIISPPGVVQNGAGKLIVDHIVDGGYFDNYGIESATNLVKALHEISPDLAPLVVVITNDPSDEQFPTDPAAAADKPTQKEQQAFQASSSSDLLSDITAPVVTVMNNRNLRGFMTYVQSSKDLYWFNKSCTRSVHLAVWRDTISLSWWLSALDQQYLHNQINDGAQNNGQPLDQIRQILKAEPNCQPVSNETK